jgi:hypothetical protein
MREEEEDVVLLDRPVIYVEPEEMVEDFVGHDEATAEYVLAQVDQDYDDLVVEEPEDIILHDSDILDEADLEVA